MLREKRSSTTCLSTTRTMFMPPLPEAKLSKASFAACIASVPRTAAKVSGIVRNFSGSGTIVKEAVRAQQILKDKFDIGTDLWSVTSFKNLYWDALSAERRNLRHPQRDPQPSYLQQQLSAGKRHLRGRHRLPQGPAGNRCEVASG